MKCSNTCKMLSSVYAFHIVKYSILAIIISNLLVPSPKCLYKMNKITQDKTKHSYLLLGISKEVAQVHEWTRMLHRDEMSGKHRDGILKVRYQKIFIPANKNLPWVSGFPLCWWDPSVFVPCVESHWAVSPCIECASEFPQLTQIDKNLRYLHKT